MTISEVFAVDQIRRCNGLKRYPRTLEAERELKLAAMSADSEKHIESVISEWLQSHEESPTPYGLLVAIRQSSSARKTRCEHCGGDGWISVPRLVTYGGGFSIIRAERLPGYTMEQVIELRDKLNENQAILTVAIPCECLPPSHKGLVK